MTAQTKQDKESGAATPGKGSPEKVVSSDSGPVINEKSHSLSQKGPQKIDEQEAAPSRHLWVGNVSTVLTEAALAEQFSRFGDIESVTVYSSRNYAFINFKTVEDAVYAKKGLQGAVLGGLAVRIEFAKGAKPCRHLWVGSICSSVTKEQLEAEFKKFGIVEDLRFLWDRNCAFVDFSKTDDAVSAYESLNRKRLGKDELRIEYGRSHSQSKKDSKPEAQLQDEKSTPQEKESTDSQTSSSNGLMKTPEKSKKDKDGEPSEVLWIGFPIYMKVDENKLYKAFAPFGGIERITTFPGRTYAFVQFQSIKAAARAKDALQGKLFDDPRVNISFAKSEVGPVDHSRGTSTFLSPAPAKVELPPIIPFSKAGNFVNPRNDRFLGLNTFRPSSPSFSSRSGPDMTEASILFQSSRYELEPNLSIGSDLGRGMRPAIERGLKSGMELWGSPAVPEGAFLHPDHTSLEDRWNIHDEALGKRELKRQRVGGGHPGFGGLIEPGALGGRGDRQPFQVVKAHDFLSRVTRFNGSDFGPPETWKDEEGPKSSMQGRMPSPRSNVEPPRSIDDDWGLHGVPIGLPKDEFQWQGIIAKSGTSVCHARGLSVSKVIDVTFPEVLNCTARTNLDMLAKHINQVGDFAVVSFIPQGELDVGPYQEFMLYLSEKKRAAVCKLSHESTLFLVPPTEFVEQFLKVPKNNTIFGVVLKLHQLQYQSPQLPTEQTDFPQPMHTQRLLPFGGLMEDSYQKSSSHVSLEQHLSEVMAIPLPPPNPLPSREMMSTHPLLPQQSNLQTSNSAGATFTPGVTSPSGGGMAGNVLGKGLLGLNNPSGHGMVTDDSRMAHQSQGYPSVQYDQHNAALGGGFSLAPTGDLRSHQEQTMQMHSHFVGSPPRHLASAPIEPYPMSAPGHGQSQVKFTSQHLSGPISFQQQPRPPQFPPSNMQFSPSDQLSQLTSLLSHQQQSNPDSLQLLQQNLQQQFHLGGQQHHAQHQTSPSNFAPISESSSATGGQPPHPPGSFFQGGGQEILSEAEQREIFQMTQQKLSAESNTKGETDEDHKRFQATLELAAALLQQLQQRTKT